MKKDLIAFYEEMGKNKGLYDELIRLRVNYSSEKNLKKGEIKNFTETCIVPLGKRFGYDFTAKDFINSISSEQELRSLSDDELKDVSGGANYTRNVILAVASVVAAAGLGFGILSQNSAYANQSSQGVQAKKDDANKDDPAKGEMQSQGAEHEEDLKNKFSPPTGGGGSDVNLLKEENERLRQENSQLAKEVRSKFGGNQSMNDPVVKRLRARIKSLEKENEGLRQKNADLNKRGSQSPKRPGAGPTNQQRDLYAEKLQKENPKLEEELESEKHKNSALSNWMTQLEAKNQSLIKDNEHLANFAEELKAELELLKNNAEKQNAVLQSEVIELNKLVQGFEQEKADLASTFEHQLGEQKSYSDSLTRQLQELEASSQKEFNDWQSERDTLIRRHGEEIEQLKDLLPTKSGEEKSSKLLEQNDSLREYIAKLEQNLKEQEKQFGNLNRELQNKENILKSQVEAFKSQINEYENQIAQLKELGGSENKELKRINGELNKAGKENEELKALIEQRDEQVGALQVEIKHFQKENNKLGQGLENLKKENFALKSEVKGLGFGYNDLVKEINSLKNENNQLKNSFDQQKNEHKNQTVQIDKLKTENKNLTDQNHRSYQEGQKLNKLIGELKKKIGETESLTDVKLESLRKRIKNLESDNMSLKEENAKLSQQCNNQIKQLEQLQASGGDKEEKDKETLRLRVNLSKTKSFCENLKMANTRHITKDAKAANKIRDILKSSGQPPIGSKVRKELEDLAKELEANNISVDLQGKGDH